MVVGTVISEEMVNDGYESITNIDISKVVIEAMKEKYREIPQLQCNFHFYLIFWAFNRYCFMFLQTAAHVFSEVPLFSLCYRVGNPKVLMHE